VRSCVSKQNTSYAAFLMYRFSVLIEFAFGDGDGLAAYPAIESPICHDVALLSDRVSAQETRPSRVDGDTLCKSNFSR